MDTTLPHPNILTCRIFASDLIGHEFAKQLPLQWSIERTTVTDQQISEKNVQQWMEL